MGADSFLVFYGLRQDFGNLEDRTIDEVAIKSLERETHPVLAIAKAAGLDTWWGDFSLTSEHYLLFIGKQIGILGWEYDSGASLSDDALKAIMEDVKVKIGKAGLEGEAQLWMQFEPDK